MHAEYPDIVWGRDESYEAHSTWNTYVVYVVYEVKYRMEWNGLQIDVQFQTKFKHKTPGKLYGQTKLPESLLFQMRACDYSRSHTPESFLLLFFCPMYLPIHRWYAHHIDNSLHLHNNKNIHQLGLSWSPIQLLTSQHAAQSLPR